MIPQWSEIIFFWKANAHFAVWSSRVHSFNIAYVSIIPVVLEGPLLMTSEETFWAHALLITIRISWRIDKIGRYVTIVIISAWDEQYFPTTLAFDNHKLKQFEHRSVCERKRGYGFPFLRSSFWNMCVTSLERQLMKNYTKVVVAASGGRWLPRWLLLLCVSVGWGVEKKDKVNCSEYIF